LMNFLALPSHLCHLHVQNTRTVSQWNYTGHYCGDLILQQQLVKWSNAEIIVYNHGSERSKTSYTNTNTITLHTLVLDIIHYISNIFQWIWIITEVIMDQQVTQPRLTLFCNLNRSKIKYAHTVHIKYRNFTHKDYCPFGSPATVLALLPLRLTSQCHGSSAP
jgi:hypothetical protein